MIAQTKKRWQIIVVSIVALFITTWLELFLQRKQHIIGGGINRSFLFLLMNLHIVVIIALLYIIIRQSIKLFVELRRKSAGSNFKKNLLFAFTIFSVIPSFFVFFVAGKLITTGIDNWFDARIQTGLQNALILHQVQTNDIRTELRNSFNELSVLELDQINQKIKSDNFNNYEIYLWPKTNKEFNDSLEKEIKTWRKFRKLNDRTMLNLKRKFLNIIFDNNLTKNITDNIIESKTKLFDFYGSLYCINSLQDYLLVLIYRYPENIRYALIDIQNSIADYEQLKSMKNPIYWSYFLTFILVTLLILFLSIWCAFYLAKGISKPIQELLNAIDKIKQGSWDVQINYDPDSDLKKLAIGFNEMSKTIQQAHNKLAQQNKEMFMILENLKEAFFYVDKFGRILSYNSASKELVKKYLNLDRFKNKKINFFGKEIKDKFFELVRILNSSGKQQLTKEITFSFKSEQKTILVHLTHMNSSFTKANIVRSNIGTGLLIIIEDLSDIVKINKIKTWQQAAKQMAHEIKNPLTPIQLATQRLQRRFSENFGENTVFTDCTNTILNHVKIIKDLVTNFSEFEQLSINNIEALDLNEIIKSVVCLYKVSYPEIDFCYDFQEFLPSLKIDKQKIKRVIINLLDNSIRALLQYKLQNEKKIIIKTSFKSGLNQLELLITDNGPGMPASVKSRLFMPYVSTEKKNMGLGLAIVYEIITQNNGTI
ncbi:HAMP domain-containing protein, partial [Candidatus Babeliales bacterium]|nr:HAMP domain-containing protein [Candidatus Babeliales bacterium]